MCKGLHVFRFSTGEYNLARYIARAHIRALLAYALLSTMDALAFRGRSLVLRKAQRIPLCL